MSTSRQHGGASSSTRPHVPEPSLAERSRTLLHVARIGTLCTLSRKQAGFPFGSMMPYALDSRGRPIFLVSSMAMHAQNLQADPRASLFVPQPGVTGDPLGAARVTLVGRTAPAEPYARSVYLKLHENAQYWIDFEDFSLIHLEVLDVYFIGGFGVMGWITAAEYAEAAPDPLADHATRILEHMNADHSADVLRIVRFFGGVEADEARMISIDRLGFDVRFNTNGQVHGTRIPFPSEIRNTEECRAILIHMSRQSSGNS